ncbi:hypothetical protein PCANC_00348 [Puccinia coronata f. sp. avenae]|uniref:Uncharacterized protein n=1 Tax=Puccinia coronata f. sp. avenae TaxID=200324 RepID=A0A2N5S2U2_9BASI|nr:hypothetical protein PCANC_27895 [Puccinia coronata f. sp. avenae]PLW45803.1 hypothetical protein PCASD_04819 [Puccinia coronata f. sp. avenae]PLW58724.1 hypothetical protein PCANC_00348 [Puccinia coronata f. sp. avenae]
MLKTINEEGEIIDDGAKQSKKEEEETNLENLTDREEEEDRTDENNKKSKGKYAATGIGFTLKKVDYVCRRIASSPAKQAEFKVWAKKLGYEGPGIIGGT